MPTNLPSFRFLHPREIAHPAIFKAIDRFCCHYCSTNCSLSRHQFSAQFFTGSSHHLHQFSFMHYSLLHHSFSCFQRPRWLGLSSHTSSCCFYSAKILVKMTKIRYHQVQNGYSKDSGSVDACVRNHIVKMGTQFPRLDLDYLTQNWYLFGRYWWIIICCAFDCLDLLSSHLQAWFFPLIGAFHGQIHHRCWPMH